MANGTPYVDPYRRRYRLGYNPAMRGRGYTPSYSQVVGNVDPLYSYYSNVNYFTPGTPRFVPPMEPVGGEEEPEAAAPTPTIPTQSPVDRGRYGGEEGPGGLTYPVYPVPPQYSVPAQLNYLFSPQLNAQAMNQSIDNLRPGGGMTGRSGTQYPYQVQGGRFVSGWAPYNWQNPEQNEPIYKPYYYNWNEINRPQQTFGLAMGPGAAEYNETLENAGNWTSSYSPAYYQYGPGRYLRSWGGLAQAEAMFQRAGATRRYQSYLGSRLRNQVENQGLGLTYQGGRGVGVSGIPEGGLSLQQKRLLTWLLNRRRNLPLEQRMQDIELTPEPEQGTGLDTANFAGALVNWRP